LDIRWSPPSGPNLPDLCVAALQDGPPAPDSRNRHAPSTHAAWALGRETGSRPQRGWRGATIRRSARHGPIDPNRPRPRVFSSRTLWSWRPAGLWRELRLVWLLFPLHSPSSRVT